MNNKNIDNFTKCDVFTPEKIARLMTSKIKSNGTVLEPSVGDGALLKHIDMSNYSHVDVYELKQTYLDCVEDKVNMRKYCVDFLKHATEEKYDNIIMNPPYIKIQDLTTDYRDYIRDTFPQLSGGMVDIYYAFIIKCLNMLTDDGVMVSITPNSFLYNKSANKLRKYLIDGKYIQELIDFKTEKVFPGISVYCCICVFTKTPKTHFTYNGNSVDYDSIDKTEYNIFGKKQNEDGNKTLKDVCKISNGIATLRDKIYIHSERLYDEPCWQVVTDGKKQKHIIYPYNNGKIIPEPEFKEQNPQTYQYLEENKAELAKRDNGNKTYATWYAYGRTQSIVKPKAKRVMYVPTFINPVEYKMTISMAPSLYQGCLCIEPKNDADTEKIYDIIKKNMDYIAKISSKRSGGWITLSSRNLYGIQWV
jgi:type I restriction-modification system DNA methylase subunit